MLKNYFKIAIRSLVNQRGYFLINIAGLSVGITCCLLIFQYVAFEYSFDDFNENAPNLYRVNVTTVSSGDDPNTTPTFGWAMAPMMAQETPEVMRFARLHPEYDNAIVSNPTQPAKAFEEEGVYYADPAFLQMFSYPLISGDPSLALTEPETIILSESVAKKYFGSKDPMGQTLDVRGWISGKFRVSGIFRDIPVNSHLQFDILLPMADLLQKSQQYKDPISGWDWKNFITYVQLHPEINVAAVEQKFTDVILENKEADWRPTKTTANVNLQPVWDIHLNKDIAAPKATMGSYRTVYFFIIIGLITLLIALVNYINLATARALNRAREVGVRKAIGAGKKQLIIQFLCESVVTLLIATTLGISLAALLIPALSKVADTTITHPLWTGPHFWTVFPGIFLSATLLAGLYPAFVLSSFKPVAALKGKAGTFAAGARLRRGLVVFQFAVSIVMLVGTMIVHSQLNHMRNMDLGMNLEQILTVPSPRFLPDDTNKTDRIAPFLQELRQLPGVWQTATSGSVPGRDFSFTGTFRKAMDDPSANVSVSGGPIDTNFLSLYGIELVAGDLTEISYSIPEGATPPMLINETAALSLGFDKPADALGEKLTFGRVAGVLKDFNWSSGHQARGNIMFQLFQRNSQISIKVNTANLSQTITSIEEIYRQHFPSNPFQYAFVDEQFEQQYKNDQRFARLFAIFTTLAIFIACLGLFGLTVFSVRQRTKEIGIRKVMGASISNVVALLSGDYIKLVLIASAIATPIAWYVMNRWLEDFAYRIEIRWWIFALGATLSVGLALLTISFQSIKAALMNPVKSLRSE
ncbi:putative ABC transport system permease protein [Anseongella ginsenosidimutans]|uniref:Putative ABC transport system permease protein n=1 Tax=Anseongella ginsenosidimutans TaxID=496056 RepID=A0A4V2UTR9_9SPHI|nr:ABC transporter permease [Anseongella ginsenosidimutans]QEC52992.1 FtsX-like permease family protein [Anseongella ginsenosidimutans]TCS87396.1 putative ABC transport system permease protein [Anseongella ginsenosidimutans]